MNISTLPRRPKISIIEEIEDEVENDHVLMNEPSRKRTIAHLYEDLVEAAEDEVATKVLLDLHTANDFPIEADEDDTEIIPKLLLYLSKLIVPGLPIDGNEEEPSPMFASQSTSKAVLGALALPTLRILGHLQKNHATRDSPPTRLLIALLALTRTSDPWTTKTLHALAHEILQHYPSQLQSISFQTSVLSVYIRPIFSRSRPAAVTPQGRKALNPIQRPAHETLDESGKLWKFGHGRWAVTVLAWAVETAKGELVQQTWHLLVPPLLTLLDDISTPVRVTGLKLTSVLLHKLPSASKVLDQTGLGEVFEDAIMPTLLFLPSLTPEEEALQLLPVAYDALLVLADERFKDGADEKKMKMGDRIMRKGVLEGWRHSGENARIAQVLVKDMGRVVDFMGIYAVKYLKDVIPLLSAILIDPFAMAYVPLLLQAIKTIQVTILNCWPRMTVEKHRLDLVQALTLCWTRVHVEQNTASAGSVIPFEKLKRELKNAGMILSASVKEVMDFPIELQPLLAADAGLRVLFDISDDVDPADAVVEGMGVK